MISSISKASLCIVVVTFVSCTLWFVNSNAEQRVYIKGKLGSGRDEVGRKVTNNDYGALPPSLAVDSKGNIFLGDYFNERIQKFDRKGKLVLTIAFDISDVDDMTVDTEDNLLVTNSHQMKICKYDSKGKLLQTINYSGKDVRWDFVKQVWTTGYIQIEKIRVDSDGNIYLKGVDELIKFDSIGNVLNKWAPISYTRATTFMLDTLGTLYLLRRHGSSVEKYSSNGILMASGKCGDLYSWRAKDGVCLLPEFIDKNGYLYWFEQGLTTETQIYMIATKTDRRGKVLGKHTVGFDPYGNTFKFDSNGNMYMLNSSKTAFWIEKVIWK